MTTLAQSLWLETPIGRMMAIGALILLVATPIAIYLNWQNDSEWTSYRNEHHCMPFAREAVLTPKGIVPGKLGWVCDDGSTHWRDY